MLLEVSITIAIVIVAGVSFLALAASRRWFYLVPREGEPTKINHSIERSVLDHLPGRKLIYLPWQQELRSVTRSGLSAVTVVFKEDMDIWFARQLVLERLRGIALPPSATEPELAPAPLSPPRKA